MLCIDHPWKLFSKNCNHPLFPSRTSIITLNQLNFVFSVNDGFNETAMRMAFADLRYIVKPFEYADNVTTEMEQFEVAMHKFNYTMESLMLELMEPCKSFIKQCTFINEDLPCDQLFFITKTTDGFCCSFNYKLVFNYKAYTKYVFLSKNNIPNYNQNCIRSPLILFAVQ